MLTRLYVDNFRALVNSDLKLGARTLLMGSNGTGKSTFGDVLVGLQLLLSGHWKADTAFSPSTLTRWQSLPQQRIEIDAAAPTGTYRYQLVVEHRQSSSLDEPRIRVARETLTIDSHPLLHFEEGVVHLFGDDHEPGPEYPFDSSRSALGTIAPNQDNQKLTWFLRWIRGLTVIRPNPSLMVDLLERDDFILIMNASNFAAWYHAVSAADKRRDRKLHDALASVLPGFEALNFESAGANRWLLRADFSRRGQRLMLRFTELSDGQRALILLYSVLHFLLADGRTVFLDEPDNFVSLDEIQPWLLNVTDMVDDGSGQLVLISHHPEIFNQWAVDHGLVAERDGCGPVRIRTFESNYGDLTPAEVIARGWSKDRNGANQ